jgi:hypothetical protein
MHLPTVIAGRLSCSPLLRGTVMNNDHVPAIRHSFCLALPFSAIVSAARKKTKKDGSLRST